MLAIGLSVRNTAECQTEEINKADRLIAGFQMLGQHEAAFSPLEVFPCTYISIIKKDKCFHRYIFHIEPLKAAPQFSTKVTLDTLADAA